MDRGNIPSGNVVSGSGATATTCVRAVDENGELSCSSPDATDEDPRVVDSHRPRNPGLRGECRIEPPGVFGIGPRRSRRKMLEWIRAEDGLTAPDCMAQQRGAALVVDGDDLRGVRLDGQEGSGARLACDAKRQLRTRFDLSEAADELERDRVLENGIDEPVAQAMPHTEDLLERGDPRPSLIRRAACEVGEIDRRAGDGVLTQTIDARGREQLRARGEDQPCGRLEAVALAHEIDRDIRLERRDVRLEEVVADVLPIGGGREGKDALEMLGNDDRGTTLDRRPVVTEPSR